MTSVEKLAYTAMHVHSCMKHMCFSFLFIPVAQSKYSHVQPLTISNGINEKTFRQYAQIDYTFHLFHFSSNHTVKNRL